MSDPSDYRDKAEQARRLARNSTDPVLQAKLLIFAQDYETHAAAIEAKSANIDPEDE